MNDKIDSKAEPVAPAVQERDSYDAIWNALQEIDSAAVFLPTFKVKHEGDIEAVTRNIVEAIQAISQQPEASGAGEREDEPTAEELEAFRRKHWSHWNAAENLLIAHLVQQLKCAALASKPPAGEQMPVGFVNAKDLGVVKGNYRHKISMSCAAEPYYSIDVPLYTAPVQHEQVAQENKNHDNS